jgi:hypothetical protein
VLFFLISLRAFSGRFFVLTIRSQEVRIRERDAGLAISIVSNICAWSVYKFYKKALSIPASVSHVNYDSVDFYLEGPKKSAEAL